MRPKIWVHEHGHGATDFVACLTKALTTAGLDVVSRKGQDPAYGIVIVWQKSPELGGVIEDLSRRGLDRLVAVMPNDTPVPGAVAWPLRRAGASDVLADADPTRIAEAVASRTGRWWAVDQMMTSTVVTDALIGTSPAWILTLRQIVEAAAFTQGSLLLIGESGTGKELIARVVHALDRRPAKKSLVVLDCTTVVPDLAGSEFFGHERGAFTGATTTRDGSFALADEGTLFLDEVGELPLPMQAQLLRVVQERTYKRVGGNEWMRANFRLIAATNRKLDEDTEGRSFRRDLFYRLASRVYHVPALRDRAEDILVLATHFLAEMRPSASPVVLDSAVREFLISHSYPGNVRELKQLACRISDRWLGCGPVTAGAIPTNEVPLATGDLSWRSVDLDQAIWRALQFGVGLQEIKEATSGRALALALEMESGSTRAAAHRLSVTERTVQMYRADCRTSGLA